MKKKKKIRMEGNIVYKKIIVITTMKNKKYPHNEGIRVPSRGNRCLC